MASIPQSGLPQVAPRPLAPNYDETRVSAASFGGALAQPLEQAGATLGQLAKEKAAKEEAAAKKGREDAQFARVAAQEAAGIRAVDSLLHGTEQDPSSGFLNTKGMAARERLTPMLTEAQKTWDALIADEKDPVVKGHLQQRAQLSITGLQRQAKIHAAQQLDQHNSAAVHDRINTGIDSAVNNWADPLQYEAAVTRTRAFVQKQANDAGDPQDTAGRWTKVQKITAERTIQRMLALGQGDLAQKFLDGPLTPNRQPPGASAPSLPTLDERVKAQIFGAGAKDLRFTPQQMAEVNRLASADDGGAPGAGVRKAREYIEQVKAGQDAEHAGRAAAAEMDAAGMGRGAGMLAPPAAPPTVRDLLGADGAHLITQVEAVSNAKSAEREAEAALPDVLKKTGEVDYDLLQGRIDKVPEGKGKDVFRARLEHRAALAQKKWRDQADDAAASVFETGQTETGRFDWGKADELAKVALETLDPTKAARLKIRSDKDRRIETGQASKAEEKAQREEWKANYADLTMEFALNKDELAKMDTKAFVSRYGPGLSKEQLAKKVEDHTALVRHAEEVPEEAVVRAHILKKLGAKPTDELKGDRLDKFVAFVEEVREQTKAYRAKHSGAPPGPDDMAKILSSTERDVVLQERWYGDDTAKPYELRAKDNKAKAAAAQAADAAQDQAALKWLRDHPNDKNAGIVRAALKKKGLVP